MISINFKGDIVLLTSAGGRPWIPIQPICDNIGVDGNAQVRRLMRHHRQAGLEVTTIKHDGVDLLCLPLEEVHWWMRTLRPRGAVPQERLREYRKGAAFFWTVLHYWVDKLGRYCTGKELRGKLTTPQEQYKPAPPPRRSGITHEMADKWRRLREEGHSYTKIAAMTNSGYSKATICQVVNGKYPVKPSVD